MSETEEVSPIDNYILIDPERPLEKTASGLYLQKAKHVGPPQIGWITAVGPNVKNEKLKPGIKVVFNKPGSEGFKYEGKSYIPVTEEQVVAIIHEH